MNWTGDVEGLGATMCGPPLSTPGLLLINLAENLGVVRRVLLLLLLEFNGEVVGLEECSAEDASFDGAEDIGGLLKHSLSPLLLSGSCLLPLPMIMLSSSESLLFGIPPVWISSSVSRTPAATQTL